VFDLLLESRLAIVAETILPIEMQLIAAPGSSLEDIRTVASHPMALAQCERFFAAHPQWKTRARGRHRRPGVREALSRGDKSSAAIAGRRAAEHYKGRDSCRGASRTMPRISRASSSWFQKKKAVAWLSPAARKVFSRPCASPTSPVRYLLRWSRSRSTV